MKFRLLRASNSSDADPLPGRTQKVVTKHAHGGESVDYIVEINTLDELMALRKEVANDLVIGDDDIWIYDDYME